MSSGRWKYIKGLDQVNPSNGPFAPKGMFVPAVAHASELTPAAGYNALFWYDSTNHVFQGCANGSAVTFATSSSVGTLDQVMTAGKTSSITAPSLTGLSSSANAIQLGDGSVYAQIYSDATDVFLASNSGDIKLVPNGSDVRVTGNVVASGKVTAATLETTGAAVLASLSVTGAFSAGSFALDAVAAATAGASLKLDGEGAGGVNICSISTGGITLSDDVTVAASKVLTVTGVGGSNEFIITAGDAVMSDGSLSITDADNAASLVLTNDTYTNGAAGVVDINCGGVVTGSIINVKADAMTTGSMVYLETSAAGMNGKYIQCYDGAADDFSVGLYGATIIAGNASGTPAVTLSAGDVLVSSGHVELTSGNVKLTSGKLDIAEGVIEVDTAVDAQCYFKRNQGTTTGDFVKIWTAAASDDHCALIVDCDSTGAVPAVEIEYAGSDSALVVTPGAAAGSALTALCAANATDSIIKVDGATNDYIGADDVGMLNLSCDGALAHADASCLRIAYSGAGAASGMGTSLRIVDTGSTATAYAAYISAGTGEALKVDAGKCTFDESCSFAASNVEKVCPNYIASETGGNNAIAGALVDADGANVALTAGLVVRVKLAHTLQAGANTFDFNGGGALPIVSSRNVANNIGTAYAATGIITLMYNGASWSDLSQ